jgi:hypothetical protein
MTEANVGIIHELKKFLNEISDEKARRKCYVYSTKAFTRKRLLPFTRIVMLIINGLKRSLQVELQSFFENFSQEQPCRKQAFCKQRIKLNPAFFHDWNQVLISNFYRSYGKNVKQWQGMNLLAVDGSSVPLPETADLKQTFGGATNQYKDPVNVTARICVVYDVLNSIAIKGFLHPYTVSEEEVIPECLSGLELKNKLLLFDRGYPSFWLMYLLMQKEAKFVMRVASNANNAVKNFLTSQETDLTIEWCPPYASLKKLRDMGFTISKHTPIKIRMVKIVLDTGGTEVLVTNLYDTNIYTQEDLKEVYHLRWGIETYYGYIKEELQLGQFSGIRQICIEQDFAANLFLFNLQSLIEKKTEPYVEAIGSKRKYRYKVNKNIAWASLKNRVVHLFLQEDCSNILIELEKLFGNYLEPIRPGRKYPRMKRRNPNVKYHTLTNYKRAI